MFNEPAVSIPIGFLTNTLFCSILEVFCIKTMAIINGSPSGTAITIITTANIKTSNKSLNTYIIPRSKYGDTPPATITL